MRFLEWLDEQGLELGTLTQPHLDQWLTTTSQPDLIRPFITWARRHHLVTDLTMAPKPRTQPEAFLDDEQRWEQLNRCVTDDTMPLDVRVTGALILLFGLPTARILHLTADNLRRNGDDTYLVLDQHPLLLPPRLGKLLLTMADQARNPSAIARRHNPHRFLFPGRVPGQPIVANTYGRRLAPYGIRPRESRNTALLTLAEDLPAVVIADFLGLHINTAVGWVRLAKRDWSTYLAARAEHQTQQRP